MFVLICCYQVTQAVIGVFPIHASYTVSFSVASCLVFMCLSALHLPKTIAGVYKIFWLIPPHKTEPSAIERALSAASKHFVATLSSLSKYILDAFFLTIITPVLSAFACENNATNGESVLVADHTIACWHSRVHAAYVFVAFYVLIGFIPLGALQAGNVTSFGKHNTDRTSSPSAQRLLSI